MQVCAALHIITVGKTTKKYNKSKIITIIGEARFETWNDRAERFSLTLNTHENILLLYLNWLMG